MIDKMMLHMDFNAPFRVALRELEGAAAAKGLNLYRYQANKGGFATTITYVLTPDTERAPQAREYRMRDGEDCYVEEFDQIEGKTERSASYRAVAKLLKRIS